MARRPRREGNVQNYIANLDQHVEPWFAVIASRILSDEREPSVERLGKIGKIDLTLLDVSGILQVGPFRAFVLTHPENRMSVAA